ncbi:MAG: DUF5069 domain-containing protein [Candidatus Eremiobacteraeota bacterium]|nr:DUF5069 domain-containing protein [Candidatus Eremiobacteraeota bacterium]MBC5826156.1 DUF5069 domain-containing protein [Candidatus Eremiobacteraeota bacterium]
MDLTKEYPRSPNDRLMGIPMLPRTIDKARAALAGALGEYVYGDKSGFDKALLGFLGLSQDEFLAGVRESPDDAAMTRWLEAHARKATPAQVEDFSRDFLSDGDDDADRARFAQRRAALPADVQSRVKRWTDLLDVAEGRIR